MIVRKPYAFLIKNFRIIHFTILSIIIYLFYRANILYSFFDNYSGRGISSVNLLTLNNLINIFTYVITFILILILIIIYVMLREKKKPKLLYLITILIYMTFFVMLLYTDNQLSIIKSYSLSLTLSRITRDILLIYAILQGILIAIFSLRSFGFDIKKFEFTKDIGGLEVNDQDREEMEVSVNFDKDKLTRFYNKTKREFVYYFKENKLILFSIIGIIIIFIIGIIISSSNNIITTIPEGRKTIKNDKIFIVEKSYITKQNYYGKVISKENTYLIIKFKIKNESTNDIKLNLGYMLLDNGKKLFHVYEEKRGNFIDIGEQYEDGTIIKTNKSLEYIVMYELKNKDITKNMTLQNQIFGNKVLLKPVNIDKNSPIKLYNIGDNIKKENEFSKPFNLEINTLEIKNKFNYNYRLCISNICKDLSDEIIAISNKQIVKIKGKLKNGNLLKLITNQSKITYENNKKIVSTNKLTNIRINGLLDNELYFYVPNESKKHDAIYLDIYTRNNTIRYIIR